ncbi:MAG: hypothetical protein OXS35_07570 [Dehalococcoidia bacterium]|nr:hypothetical protein [Dehalococcoidia bacterium]
MAAAEALGVNYRTMMACHESRKVSRRMRKALEEFKDKHGDGDGEQGGDADGRAQKVVALEERVKALEAENQALRETIDTQARQLAELEHRVEAPEEGDGQGIESDASEDEEGQRHEWRPPRRDHGLPDAGVVTLEEQPDEEHAFGPAAPLVAEWRGLRTGGEASGGRVDRAKAAVHRWELEVAMLGDYGLTLPPETEPLDASRREDHLRWRREALAAALAKARRLRWLRKVLTLGLRWG